MYNEGARIELKNGKTATIVEVLDEGKMYVADIDLEGDWDTVFVKHEEIDICFMTPSFTKNLV